MPNFHFFFNSKLQGEFYYEIIDFFAESILNNGDFHLKK